MRLKNGNVLLKQPFSFTEFFPVMLIIFDARLELKVIDDSLGVFHEARDFNGWLNSEGEWETGLFPLSQISQMNAPTSSPFFSHIFPQ